MAEIQPSETRYYFGRSWLGGDRQGFKGFDLSWGGMPGEWDDAYAARLIASGYSVERVRYVRRPHPNPDFDGEMHTVREVVETLHPGLADPEPTEG